jgi:hypothetical protein
MIETERLLEKGLAEGHEVDGHDVGSEEVNIFIHTDEPETAFHEIKALLQDNTSWRKARVAYRELDQSKYTVLWPPGLRNFRVA